MEKLVVTIIQTRGSGQWGPVVMISRRVEIMIMSKLFGRNASNTQNNPISGQCQCRASFPFRLGAGQYFFHRPFPGLFYWNCRSHVQLLSEARHVRSPLDRRSKACRTPSGYECLPRRPGLSDCCFLSWWQLIAAFTLQWRNTAWPLFAVSPHN